jgi:site-specific DNA-methyltransferase (adenine-specific)
MGKYSVCDVFDDDSGNIRYNRTLHTWKDGKCVCCGANQENYDRGGELETHAYEFIHTEIENGELRIEKGEWGNMKFDVIVGNPPYQLSDGGGGIGTSAIPLYDKFVHQAKKMNPQFLSMIIPARWFSGGRGLDVLRDEILNDKRILKKAAFYEVGKQKAEWAKNIGVNMDVHNNTSQSFNYFKKKLEEIAKSAEQPESPNA